MLDKCTKCGSGNIILIEYPHDHPDHYDGISEINCMSCKARIGYWSGKDLKDGETEKPYGKEN